MRLLSAIAVVLLASTACTGISLSSDRIDGSGDRRSETRQIGSYDGFDLRGEGRVEFGAAADGEVVIETDENLLEEIEVDVDDGELIVATRSGVDIEPSDGVVYRIGCPAMRRIILSGAGEIDVGSCTSVDDLALVLRGAGSISAEANAGDVEATISGAGSIRLRGRASEVEVTVSGAGDFDGSDLEVVDARAVASGAGSIHLWVTGSLDAEVSGAGDITYRGEPAVAASVTGSGSIEPAP